MAFNLFTKFTAVDKFSKVTRVMSKSVKSFAVKAEIAVARADRAFTRLTSPIRRVSRALGSFGLILGATAIIGVVGNAVSVFANFEQANANLASVMATATGPELISLQADAKRLGAITAKTATEVVGLQEAFARLGFETPDIINMTEATISGSIAMRGELSDTAELVGAMIKTFDDFSAIDTPEIIDQLTVATQSSALNFEKLQTGLPIVAGAANAAGVPFTRLVALLGKLSDAGIDTSSSATALRNIFIESAKQGLSYSQILSKIEKNQDKLTAANDEFGKRAAVSAAILSKSIRATDELDEKLRSAAKGHELSGAAALAATKQLNTLRGASILLNSAWEGWILSLEDGTGALANTLKRITQVATEMLSLASGTAKASDKLNEQEKRTRALAQRGIFWLKVIGVTILGLLALKAILVTASIVMGTWALGVKLVTGATLLWNAVLAANPIVLIILGILALIAAITLLIVFWDEIGVAWEQQWLLMRVTAKQAINDIKSAWQTLLGLFGAEVDLTPAFKFSKKEQAAARAFLGEDDINVTDESGKPVPKAAVNPKAAEQEALTKTIESFGNAKINIDVNDPNQRTKVTSDSDIVEIATTSTLGLVGQ
ncbi:hypothetical protein LCGC14_0716310 [marine sediment metagenome]|uniref:Phage tail tape measure protein domain-containing protein n=1 Tax=marine sediment metagenome TaxID=412755 RepID=A0A0F9QYS3_9ZZZZ